MQSVHFGYNAEIVSRNFKVKQQAWIWDLLVLGVFFSKTEVRPDMLPKLSTIITKFM